MNYVNIARVSRSVFGAAAVISMLGMAMSALVATGNIATAGDTVAAGAEPKTVAARINLRNLHEIRKLDIFGSELMTKSEIAKFRQDIKKVKTQKQLDRFLSLHRQRMDKRAIKRGVELN